MFHESWHRVAALKPRLRASVRVTRQHFRGQRWHVIEDPASGLFYRMNDAAYDLVARLDGRATVGEAWGRSVERLGDESTTQGEAIGLLGQLWGANLLWAEAPGDARAMFARQGERRAREWRGYLSSLFFVRLPLLDPDAFLNRWAPLVGWLVGPIGALGWVLLVAIGAWHLLDHSGSLLAGAATILAGDNLLPLYLTYAAIKALHELGHAVACKVFGLRGGRGGEVHVIGVMFLIFLPIPYVDATSSWALRSRLQRIVVAGAGMIVEIACAAIAAIVWARTAEGTVAHAVAYNAIFLASLSTILFNGNPLLRYDGYYILSDLLGMPNLASRSREHLQSLVKRFAWGVRGAADPAHDSAEAWLLFLYGVLSGAYRILVSIGLAVFIASQQLLLGGAILVLGVFAWLILPAGRFVHYLARHPELDRTRGRAVLSTAAAALILLVPAAVIPMSDYAWAEGVAEPSAFEVVHARADGFIESAAASGSMVQRGGATALVVQRNDELDRRRAVLDAEIERLRVTRALAFRDDPARALQMDGAIAAAGAQRDRVEEQIASLRIESSIAGRWIAPALDRMVGASVRRGTRLGLVADLSEMRVRAVLDQRSAAMVIDEGGRDADIRARLRPAHRVRASVLRVLPAGQEVLPSAALGVESGGATPTKTSDAKGIHASEAVFEAWLSLPPDHALLPGQRVVVRFTLRPRPLLAQGWRSLRQALQEKFNI